MLDVRLISYVDFQTAFEYPKLVSMCESSSALNPLKCIRNRISVSTYLEAKPD